MAVQQQLGDYNHCKCPLLHQRKTLSQLNPTLRKLPKVRTGWLDLGQTGHFDNETELLQRVFAEKSSLLALQTPCYNAHPDNMNSSKITGKNELQMFCLK